MRIADFGMEDDKEDDKEEEDEVYGTWECVTTAVLCYTLPAHSVYFPQVHGAGVPQPQARPPRIRLRRLQRRHHHVGGK